MFKLPILVILWTDFPIKVQQLLELLVPRWHNILDDGHYQCRLDKDPLTLNAIFPERDIEDTCLGVAIDRGDDDFT